MNDLMSMITEPYRELGVRRAVNAAGIITRIGGSRSPPEIFKAMEAASKHFVTIAELQSKAGEYIAEVMGAESALPTAGGSCSIMLAAAACIMKDTELEEYEPIGPAVWRHIAQRLPLQTDGLKTQFIVQKCNRDEYDHAVQCAGGLFVEVGDMEGTSEEQLRNAYDPENTAAYYYTMKPSNGLPLEAVVRIAHENNVPVIIDACMLPPPKSALRLYISMGVDLVCMSGGKIIAGPNNTGILAGRRDLIKLAHLQSYPFEGVGRPAKMCRETIVALVTALKLYLKTDDSLLYDKWLKKINKIAEKLNKIPGIIAGIDYYKDMNGNPLVPLCTVRVDEEIYGMTTRDLHLTLIECDPSIVSIHEPYFLLEDYADLFSISPQYLSEGEDDYLITQILEFNLN